MRLGLFNPTKDTAQFFFSNDLQKIRIFYNATILKRVTVYKNTVKDKPDDRHPCISPQ